MMRRFEIGRNIGFLIAGLAFAMPAAAKAPEKSMTPVIRPTANETPPWAVRPTLRPGDTSAVLTDVGENSPVPADGNDTALIDAALLAADAMRAVGVIDGEAGTLVIAERNIDPAMLNIDPEPDVGRLADVLPAVRPTIEKPPENTVEADPGLEISPEEEAAVVSRLAPMTVDIWPTKRPRFVVRTPTPEPEPTVEVASAGVVAPPVVAPPPKRPKGLLAAIFRAPDKPAAFPKEGSVCGDPAIRGQTVPPIPAKLSGCGLSNPVRITAVDGVQLTTPATVNCATAQAFRSWISNSVKPTVGNVGGGVGALRVAASYSCRTRNNIPGAKISEHGRGNAIDISAVILKDGTAITLLRGWRHEVFGPMLKAMHAQACGTFGTVLGPNSDRHHQDHFHFDLAKHGYGPYCR